MKKFLGLLVLTVLLVMSQAQAASLHFYGSSGQSLGSASSFSCGTGVTCTKTGSRVNIASSPTLASAVAITGTEGTNGVLTLAADDSDDSGDDWSLRSLDSGNSFTINNDTSGSQVAKFTISTAGAVSMVGDLSGDGGDQLVGFLQNQVAASTTPLTAAQCGSTIISAGAAVQPLPEASTVLGCRYTIICGTADDLDIDPADASDVIGVINAVAAGTGSAITPSAGDGIRCTDIGSSIVLEATGANLWSAVGVANGAWTDVN